MENPINFLVDTNIWLERLLEQDQSDIVKVFLETIPSENLSISDFSLHSIGVILTKLERFDIFDKFILDLFSNGDVSCLSIKPLENINVANYIKEMSLDFDDSYQFVISQKFEIQIVTFDKDFKKRGIKTLTPKEAIEKFKKMKK